MIIKIVPIFLIVLISCGRSSLGSEAYIAWCDKNLIYDKTIESTKFSVKVYSDDYRIAKQLTTEKEVNQMDYKTVYLHFKIQNAGGEEALLGSYNTEDFNKNINYFIEQAKQDFTLVVGADSLNPSLYHFERTYSMTNYIMLDMSFELPKKQPLKNCEIIYRDQKLNSGRVIIGLPNLNSDIIPNLNL